MTAMAFLQDISDMFWYFFFSLFEYRTEQLARLPKSSSELDISFKLVSPQISSFE